MNDMNVTLGSVVPLLVSKSLSPFFYYPPLNLSFDPFFMHKNVSPLLLQVRHTLTVDYCTYPYYSKNTRRRRPAKNRLYTRASEVETIIKESPTSDVRAAEIPCMYEYSV